MTLILLIVALWTGKDNALAKTPGLESVQILSGWQNVNGSYTAALIINLEPEWKTYWHTPGEAGIRPQFSFFDSRNVESIRFIWPAPILFGGKDMWSVGYKDRLVLPFILTPKNSVERISLELSAMIGICNQVCVPADFEISQNFSPATKKRDPKIIAALASRPKQKAAASVRDLECSFSTAKNAILLTISLKMPSLGKQEVIMVNYDQPEHEVRTLMASRNGLSLSGKALISHLSKNITGLDLSKIFLTAVSETSAVDLGPCED